VTELAAPIVVQARKAARRALRFRHNIECCQPAGGDECEGCEADALAVRMLFQLAIEHAKALRLLREAAGCIRDELEAAGADEVAGHPTLRHHGRVFDRVWRHLKEGGA